MKFKLIALALLLALISACSPALANQGKPNAGFLALPPSMWFAILVGLLAWLSVVLVGVYLLKSMPPDVLNRE